MVKDEEDEAEGPVYILPYLAAAAQDV